MDSYEKIKKIGRGSHGLVMLCRHREGGEMVVIKEILIDHLTLKEKEVTMNEVQVLSKLKHPNVIAYYHSVIQETSVHIVMEYANMGSLHDFLLAQDGKLLLQKVRSVVRKFTDKRGEILRSFATADIIEMFGQLVLGLHYIHSQKILHRDLKTHNILLSQDEKVFSRPILKIGDFGISKILASQSKASSVLGTPAYISPELCQGLPYDVQSDMWALGCILYEMVTLQKAFDSHTLASLVMKIMHGHTAPIDSTVYSPAMQNLIHDLLQTSPTSRPTTSALLAHPLLISCMCNLGTALGRLS